MMRRSTALEPGRWDVQFGLFKLLGEPRDDALRSGAGSSATNSASAAANPAASELDDDGTANTAPPPPGD